MKNHFAALLYSATALTFIGMAQPAAAQTIPMPPYPGDPSASNSKQIIATVAACNSPGTNGFLGLPSTVGQGGIGVGVQEEYGPPINGTLQGHNYVVVCLQATDLQDCYNKTAWATTVVQSIAEAYSGLHFNGVSYWVQGQMAPPEYCTAKFGAGTGGGGGGGTGGTGGSTWVLENQGTNSLVLMTPNGTPYEEKTYTDPATCQTDRTALINACYNNKLCNGHLENKSFCPEG